MEGEASSAEGGLPEGAPAPDPLLRVGRDSTGIEFDLDPSTLTKHALVLGATGSGKTVFCKAIIEEAALKGIPVLAIDPKGDIAGLAIASKDFQFTPYSDVEADTQRQPRTEYARRLQSLYAEKTSEGGTSPEKVARFVDGVEVRIYTPKSSAGIPVSISPNLDPPPNYAEMVREEPNTVLDLLDLAVTSLLKIVRPGDDDRNAASYLSEILRDCWSSGRPVDLNVLIQLVLRPPFSTFLGLPVDQGIPRKERIELARDLGRFNADPRLQGWMQGDPLDFDTLFRKGAKTPVNVVYLRGIQTEEERSFFVENLLQKLYSWMMKQQGVQNLRYLLYFDEVVGYCPPVREPPSKKGLLLLIKQGRAFGLGIVLATQNPGDIDYKALSNVNVRLIGRLATQRDIDKVKIGLDLPEDSALTIQTLDKGRFLYQVSDPRSSGIVSPRWLMTYHRGPLQDEEIAELMKPLKDLPATVEPAPVTAPDPKPEQPAVHARPPPPEASPVAEQPITEQQPAAVQALGVPFAIRRDDVLEHVKRQRRVFGQKEVVVRVTPVSRLILELGVSMETGFLSKSRHTRYLLMDAVTGKDVEVGGRLALRPGLEPLSGLGTRDIQVLRIVPDNRETSAIELASRVKASEDIVRESLRTLEGARLVKSTRVGTGKLYQRTVAVPVLEGREERARLNQVEPVEASQPPRGRSEAELRQAIRGLREDYELVSYRPFYYPLFSVELALEGKSRQVWIDGVSGEETQL